MWVIRGLERIEILNEMLAKAKHDNNEALSIRIEEVIEELKELTEYQ